MSTPSTNLPAAQAAPQNENLPGAAAPQNAITESSLTEITSAVQGAQGKDLDKLETASINLSTEYLSFDELLNTPVRRIFCGWTLRQSVDPTTGEEKGYLPAAILYDPKTEKMQVNMAAILVGTIRDAKIKPGSAVQITHTGLKKTKTGKRAQEFDIRTLETLEA